MIAEVTMLTECEQAVKSILLEELGGFSCAEHRHIKDRLDGGRSET